MYYTCRVSQDFCLDTRAAGILYLLARADVRKCYSQENLIATKLNDKTSRIIFDNGKQICSTSFTNQILR